LRDGEKEGGDREYRHNCMIVFGGWPGMVDGDVLSIEGCRLNGVGRI